MRTQRPSRGMQSLMRRIPIRVLEQEGNPYLFSSPFEKDAMSEPSTVQGIAERESEEVPSRSRPPSVGVARVIWDAPRPMPQDQEKR